MFISTSWLLASKHYGNSWVLNLFTTLFKFRFVRKAGEKKTKHNMTTFLSLEIYNKLFIWGLYIYTHTGTVMKIDFRKYFSVPLLMSYIWINKKCLTWISHANHFNKSQYYIYCGLPKFTGNSIQNILAHLYPYYNHTKVNLRRFLWRKQNKKTV